MNNVIVPVVYLSVPNLFLRVQSHVFDVKPRATLEIAEPDLVEFLSKWFLGLPLADY